MKACPNGPEISAPFVHEKAAKLPPSLTAITPLRLKPGPAAGVAPQTQRDKRCALAAGIAGDGATIDDGPLFIQADPAAAATP